MESVIVLVMHGAPPSDFPQPELLEFFGLRARLERAPGLEREAMERRYAQLEAKIRAWPRTERNDPFYAGSQALAEQLSRQTGYEVVVAFNEFCAPSLKEAFDQAVAKGAGKLWVITPMMTRGGEHGETEIPAAVQEAQKRYPDVSITYVWPFEPAAVARFLAEQIKGFSEK